MFTWGTEVFVIGYYNVNVRGVILPRTGKNEGERVEKKAEHVERIMQGRIQREKREGEKDQILFIRSFSSPRPLSVPAAPAVHRRSYVRPETEYRGLLNEPFFFRGAVSPHLSLSKPLATQKCILSHLVTHPFVYRRSLCCHLISVLVGPA